MRIRDSKTLNAINVCHMAWCALYQAEYILECVPFFMEASVCSSMDCHYVCVDFSCLCSFLFYIIISLCLRLSFIICTLFAIVYVCSENGIFNHAPHVVLVDCLWNLVFYYWLILLALELSWSVIMTAIITLLFPVSWPPSMLLYGCKGAVTVKNVLRF